VAAGLPRTHARRAAVQALYQYLVNGQSLEKESLDFVAAENSEKMDAKYFSELVDGVSKQKEQLDEALSAAVDRSIGSIDPVESSILRLAVYEFINRPDIPYRVVLNEAVELAKSMGGEQGHKYVNGVLDKVGAELRTVEYKAAKASRKK
jgi:N utilization substance protein B